MALLMASGRFTRRKSEVLLKTPLSPERAINLKIIWNSQAILLCNKLIANILPKRHIITLKSTTVRNVLELFNYNLTLYTVKETTNIFFLRVSPFILTYIKTD